MAVFRVSATRDGALFSPEGPDWLAQLRATVRALPPGAPICVLIHGYRFSCRGPRGEADPYRLLYAGPEGWAARLGFRRGGVEDGLCLAFGWEARTFRSGGQTRGFSRIYRDAAVAARALGWLMRDIGRNRPDLRIDLMAHSLGARVALQAAAALPGLPVGRLILLGAAEFRDVAAGRLAHVGGAQVYHVMSRANDLFDHLFAAGARSRAQASNRSLGSGGIAQRGWSGNWLDLQLDLPELGAWMAARGHRLRPIPRVCHWHFYTDPGAMSFYRAILRQRAAHGIGALLADGLPDRIEPRWTRLLPHLRGFDRDGGLGDGLDTGGALPNRS
ncbi:MAG: hypothetical protein AAF415_07540 [Pseudomonadota bacterium]